MLKTKALISATLCFSIFFGGAAVFAKDNAVSQSGDPQKKLEHLQQANDKLVKKIEQKKQEAKDKTQAAKKKLSDKEAKLKALLDKKASLLASAKKLKSLHAENEQLNKQLKDSIASLEKKLKTENIAASKEPSYKDKLADLKAIVVALKQEIDQNKKLLAQNSVPAVANSANPAVVGGAVSALEKAVAKMTIIVNAKKAAVQRIQNLYGV